MQQPQQPPKYRFYPSLLDKFEKYLRVDRELESFWNQDEDGNYKRTYEEIEKELKQSLIDSINRVPFDSEAADKGTVFNELVDSFVNNRRSERVTMKGDIKNDIITAEYNGRTFIFSYHFVCKAAEYFYGCVNQLFVSAPVQTKYGTVELYGYIDELKQDVVYDIKTTSKYEFGKYSEYWQRHAYPYCLIESGQMDSVKAFEFTAYALKGGTGRTPVITGVQYPEVYAYNHETSTMLLQQHSERFIEFLEANKELITDKKIFGGDK